MTLGHQPLVVAHRGSSLAEPEHSLAAYQRAIAEGADALECDVRLTRDGHLVLLHDRRISRVSNGRRTVSASRRDELECFDYSRGHIGDSDDDGPAGHRTSAGFDPRRSLLTLERLLTEAEGHHVALSIETKHPTRHGGRVETALIDLLERRGWLASAQVPRLRLMSFSHLAVRRFHASAPAIPAVFLIERMLPWHRDGSLPRGATTAGPSIDIVRRDPGYVARVHERGGEVHVWTVDSDADIDLCLNLGVDAIISNRPGHVRRRLG